MRRHVLNVEPSLVNLHVLKGSWYYRMILQSQMFPPPKHQKRVPNIDTRQFSEFSQITCLVFDSGTLPDGLRMSQLSRRMLTPDMTLQLFVI